MKGAGQDCATPEPEAERGFPVCPAAAPASGEPLHFFYY